MTWVSLQGRLLRVSVLTTAIAITVMAVISKVQVATSLGIAFALAALAMVGAAPRLNWRAALPGAILVGALLAWCALGLLWSVDPGFSTEKLARVLPILLLGPVMIVVLRYAGDVDGPWLGRALLVGIVAGMVWIVVGKLVAALGATSGWPAALFPSGSGVNAGLTTLAIVIWLLPLADASSGGRARLAAVCACAAILLFSGGSAAGIVGFAVGATVYLVSLWRRRLGTLAMLGVLIAWTLGPIVVAPIVYDRAWDTIGNLPHSWQHRVEIWDAAVDHAVDRPIFGTGFDTFRLLEHDQPSRLDPLRYHGEAVHPHHALLQVWVETGLVGVGLLTALMVCVVRQVLTWPDPQRAAGQAAITSASVILALSYGIWQGWWLAFLFAASGYALGLLASTRGSRWPADAPATGR